MLRTYLSPCSLTWEVQGPLIQGHRVRNEGLACHLLLLATDNSLHQILNLGTSFAGTKMDYSIVSPAPTPHGLHSCMVAYLSFKADGRPTS